MMGRWTFGLAGLACAAMVAFMRLPMAAGMIRSRWRRRHPNAAGRPLAGRAAEQPASASGGRSSVDG